VDRAARYGRGRVSETLVIPRRFNGPPDSGNGGYTCGLVAGLLNAGIAEVSLRAPPPLETPLEVRRVENGVEVHDVHTLIAEGRPADLDLTPPAPVDPELAERAAREGYPHWIRGHPFPTCVVCGPQRDPGDGYRVFPGELPGDGLFAASWTPDPSLAGPAGLVRPECVWGALDCPTAAPVANFGEGPAMVLARLTASLERPVPADRRHALVSWPLEVDGRKRQAGAALFDDEANLLARSRALWIELRR
jgi:hypothetical protein